MCRTTSNPITGLRLAGLQGQRHGLKSGTPNKPCARFGCALGCLSVSLKRHKTYSIIVEFTRMLHVSDQAGCGNVPNHRASHTLSSERVLAIGYGPKPQERLVVDGVLRRSVSRVCRHAAIQQNTASRILSQGRYAGSVSWPGAAKEIDSRAFKVRQGLRFNAGHYRYNGQCGVCQRVDRHRLQDVRARRSLGVAKHVVLEENACRTKTRRLKQPSKRFMLESITSEIEKKQSRQVSHQSAYCVQSGEHTKHHFIASGVAYSTKRSLTFTTLIEHHQSETLTSLWHKAHTKESSRKSKSVLRFAPTAIASCITTSAS